MQRGFLRDCERQTEHLVSAILNQARRQKITQKKLGDLIGVSQGRMSQKFKNNDFTVLEMFKMLDVIGDEIVLQKRGE